MSAIDVLVRSSLVLLAGFGALWLLSRQAAALRHWTLAFVILLAAVAAEDLKSGGGYG